MPIAKKYVTWKAKKINDNCYQHPCTEGRANIESNWDVNFIETWFQAIDWTYMWIAEHDWALPQARLDALMIVDPEFQFVSVTEAQVNAYMLEAYWLIWGEQAVSYSNYEPTDLRPKGVI